jgi:hypothetical protein
MLHGLVFKGKTIDKVMKTGDKRIIYYSDGTKETVDKEIAAGLAKVQGGIQGSRRSRVLTPFERKKRLEKSLGIKKSWLERDTKDFIRQRDLVSKLATQVEGAPEVKYVRHRGVNVPVIADYYNRKPPSTKVLMDRVKGEMGLKWSWKLRRKLATKTPSQAMAELIEEYKRSSE